MSFEDIILSEISWIEKTNIVWSHIQNTSVSLIKTKSQLVIAGVWGFGENGKMVKGY